jgi:hypothetical protein
MADVSFREYRPELIPRRGEWSAWGSALLAGITWLTLRLFGSSISTVMFFLAVILVFAAMSISLSNWVDRQTIIRLTDHWIEFHSGLRHVRLTWPEIRQVRVLPSRWGDKVYVIGDRAHFSFRKLGEVWYQNELRGRMGFEKGDEILHKIILSSDLKQMVEQDGEGSYYARSARS